MSDDSTPHVSATVGELFTLEPRQWGLRGDPFLWRTLRDRLSTTELPSTSQELMAALRHAFAEEVGVDLDSAENQVFVGALAHGGMSSGHVSLPWWRDTGFPLLIERWRAARG